MEGKSQEAAVRPVRWMTGDGGIPAVVETLQQRLDPVVALVEAPLAMRELIEAVDASRSTVRRGVRDLEDAGFVTRVDGGYRATPAGRLAADACRDYLDRVRSLHRMREALAPLSPRAPLDPSLADGEAYVATGAAPYRPLEPIRPVFDLMFRYRAPNATIPDPWFLERLRDRTGEGDLTGEMLVTPAVRAVLAEAFPDLAADLATSDGFRALETDGFRFGLLLAEVEADGADDVAPGTHVFLVVGHGDGATHAVVHATSTAAREWAEETCGRLRADATDVTGTLDGPVG